MSALQNSQHDSMVAQLDGLHLDDPRKDDGNIGGCWSLFWVTRGVGHTVPRKMASRGWVGSGMRALASPPKH
ncbi:hypothetical protein GUJ93_ZPchr0001g32361 [Zizania palustris]|uniref:Uncharacterized protein n=1 Tax=Zizania palustris TaxID=103762 RepID=A0A8J5RNB0_ZIZPA|nr:hypothetical protein GUJ93_ZPchr0001g32361 [Zizania palustris]